MGMGDQNSVDTTERLRKNLLTEIGTGINEDTCTVGLYQYRATQTLILGVCTLTNLTLATYHGYATRCACAEECDSHIIFTSGLI
jgi:hypothetical protein